MCFNQKLQVFGTGAIFSYSHEAEYVYISCDLRLQDYCERLMFYDPIEYGRKADDMLWRRVFYDVIQLTKQNKNVRACLSLLSVRPLYSLVSLYYYSCFVAIEVFGGGGRRVQGSLVCGNRLLPPSPFQTSVGIQFEARRNRRCLSRSRTQKP